jgi:hypothetical protein
MTHDAKYDWWILAAIALGIGVLLVARDYWIVCPVLLVLTICAYPQTYVTTPSALVVRAGLVRRSIPYNAIRFVGVTCGDEAVEIQYGPNSHVYLAPSDPSLFFRDLAQRTPHLTRRGQRLTGAFA